MDALVTLTMNPAIDQTSTAPFITNNAKLRCSPPHYDPGGGGINVARAITTLGETATAVYPVGGCEGNLLVRLLNEQGIAHRGISVEGSTHINLSVIDEATGRQYRFNMPGAPLREQEWRRCLQTLADLPTPRFLVLSGSLPPGVPRDFYRQAAGVVAGAGCKTIVDTSGEALTQAIRDGVYLIKPNLRELGELAGRKIENEDDLVNTARSLIEANHCEVVVVSLGAAGAFYVSQDRDEHIFAPLVPVRSRVGAGDSMVAGITVALSRNESMDHAVRFGIAAGAAAVMRPGTELSRRDDTERLFERMKRPLATAACARPRSS